jgi:hypothetical protein
MIEATSQSRFLIWARRILGGLVLLILLVLISGYIWLRQSLPQLEGDIETVAIAAPVTVSCQSYSGTGLCLLTGRIDVTASGTEVNWPCGRYQTMT